MHFAAHIVKAEFRFVEFHNMGFLVSVFLCLVLVRTSSCRPFQESDRPGSRLHLPLYRHVPTYSGDRLSMSEELALDNNRVEFLNARLDGRRNWTAENVVDSISAKVPLDAGISIGIGNYYTKIGLGTPVTYHDVVMDTGSSFSWIQCEPCLVYCHPETGSRFVPSASGTYKKLSCATSQCSSLKVATLNSPTCSASNTCIYSATYGDQSFSVGFLSQDSLHFGAESVPGFVFGCGEDNRGLFGKSAGLIGLGKNQLSFLTQLSGKSGISFSYCLPTSSFSGKVGGGGYLSIGTGSSPTRSSTPMLSDPRDPTLYFVKLTAITLSGKPLTVPSSGYSAPTIIDSGTVISRLSTSLYTALSREFARIVSTKYKAAGEISILDTCFQGTFGQISAVAPSVELIFQGGASLKLAPYNVILEVEKGTTCLAFAGSSGVAIIGNKQQQTFDISFDVSGSRILFAAAACS